MAKRANGTGTVRRVTRVIGGKKYEYWEARYTDGVDLGTGKQRRRSICTARPFWIASPTSRSCSAATSRTRISA